MKPYFKLKCYADAPFPTLLYHFSSPSKAKAFAVTLLADGYHTIEVLRYADENCTVLETLT